MTWSFKIIINIFGELRFLDPIQDKCLKFLVRILFCMLFCPSVAKSVANYGRIRPYYISMLNKTNLTYTSVLHCFALRIKITTHSFYFLKTKQDGVFFLFLASADSYTNLFPNHAGPFNKPFSQRGVANLNLTEPNIFITVA